jgi:hypothetical protein
LTNFLIEMTSNHLNQIKYINSTNAIHTRIFIHFNFWKKCFNKNFVISNYQIEKNSNQFKWWFFSSIFNNKSTSLSMSFRVGIGSIFCVKTKNNSVQLKIVHSLDDDAQILESLFEMKKRWLPNKCFSQKTTIQWTLLF